MFLPYLYPYTTVFRALSKVSPIILRVYVVLYCPVLLMLICWFNEFIAVPGFILAIITAKGKEPAVSIFPEPSAVHMEIEYVGLATVINSF